MSGYVHPSAALFDGEKAFPVIPACEHFAGSEKLIIKALEIQQKMGPVFDITCDCEDGAATGKEAEHAQMVARVINDAKNEYQMVGVRVHDFTHPCWQQDIDILMPQVGDKLAYITLPKATDTSQVKQMIDYIQSAAKRHQIEREIPIHVLIETHGALQSVWEIAALEWVQVLDFGMMDFVSGHLGAIPAVNMRSPGQFEHPLIARAKTEISAAALANGVIPSHNVTLDLKNTQQTQADASRAKNEFGYLRMWSIYPTQIETIINAMKPDYSEIKDAEQILLAAQEADWGPIQYEGELHDRATYRYYWQLLQRAKISGVILSDNSLERFFA
ncbi:HpcH/HpaI aldolase/citrate lyase family protein [Aliikangiella maris]|uniref:Aldolase/citrate lyase family protein n=2 Tax=Aliikangiella maris TaxID=3162458 RepID=A0ABV3MQR5_9GAMM